MKELLNVIIALFYKLFSPQTKTVKESSSIPKPPDSYKDWPQYPTLDAFELSLYGNMPDRAGNDETRLRYQVEELTTENFFAVEFENFSAETLPFNTLNLLWKQQVIDEGNRPIIVETMSDASIGVILRWDMVIDHIYLDHNKNDLQKAFPKTPLSFTANADKGKMLTIIAHSPYENKKHPYICCIPLVLCTNNSLAVHCNHIMEHIDITNKKSYSFSELRIDHLEPLHKTHIVNMLNDNLTNHESLRKKISSFGYQNIDKKDGRLLAQ